MRRTWILILWLIADALAFVLAYGLAYLVKVGPILSTNFPVQPYLQIVILIAPLWLIVLFTLKSFHLLTDHRSLRSIISLLYAAVIGTALFALAYFFSYGLFFSRTLLLVAFALTFINSLIVHWLFDVWQRKLLRRDPPVYPTLIVGVTRESMNLVERLNGLSSPLKPVAILDGRGSSQKSVDGVPVLGRLNLLEETLKSMRITHIIQASDLEQSINLLSACRSHGITYLMLPSVLGIIGDDESVALLEGQPVTIVEPSVKRWWKEFL